MHLRVLLVVVVCAALAVSSTGCSFLAPATQPVTIAADHPEAAIFINGRQVGAGEVTLSLRKNEHYRVHAEHSGRRSRIVHVSPQISTVGVFDLVGAAIFLIPAIGAFAPGFYVLSPTHVRLKTDPSTPTPTPPPSQPPQQPGPQQPGHEWVE